MSSDGGKGSAPRPIPDPQKFRDNWDQIFGKKVPSLHVCSTCSSIGFEVSAKGDKMCTFCDGTEGGVEWNQ